jgi:hypothetical protein
MKKKAKIAFIPKTEYVTAYCPQPEPMSKNLPLWWREQSPYVNNKKEINNGQLIKIIRDKYMVDAKGFNKIMGVPITKGEIIEEVEGMI